MTRAILLVADVALIPCGPSVLDLRAASDAVRALEQVHRIRGEIPRGAFIPNKLQKNYRLSKELLMTAKTLGLAVTPGLGLRQAFADSAGQRSVVWRMSRQAEPAEPAEKRIAVTLRLPERIAHALIDASAGRRKKREQAWSQQDIVGEVLGGWLESQTR